MISQAFIVAALAVTAFASLHHEPDHHTPKPYKFSYSVKDKHGEQHREEVGDSQKVKGSYGFTDARGVHRQVNYVADHAGFRAQVKTNEPGTANQNPAAVQISSDAPYGQEAYAGAAGLGDTGLGYDGVGAAGFGNGYAGVGGAGLGISGAVGMGNEVVGGAGQENGYAAGPAVFGGNNRGNGLLSGLGYTRYGY